MPVRLCATTGCGETAHYRGRCAKHAREQSSPSKFAHIYSTKRWRMLRRGVITANPICVVCDARLSVIGDHIKPLGAGGAPFDPANVQALCKPCHSAKTSREMGAA